jgi:predicted helicase
LLAYYIASINIENAYHYTSNSDSYVPFNGICLTDTFQLHEDYNEDRLFADPFKQNSERMEDQKKIPIKVITGNPPYSIGQRSANDNAQNQSYPKLNRRIVSTYALKSNANLLLSLYDSYIKAFRWASDRINADEGGIIAFITNAGWIDGNAMDGMRKCLYNEFNKIYVLNLRGDQRTQGELSRKEGGKIFGSGSRAPIAITFLIKNPLYQSSCEIYYHDIGDYLSREQKLSIIATKHDIYNQDINWKQINPNESGDWINQRSNDFINFIAIGDKGDKQNSKTFFKPYYSNGLKTSRDAFCYNFSKIKLQNNILETIEYYNNYVDLIDQHKLTNKLTNKLINLNTIIDYNSHKFSWDIQQKKDVINSKKYTFSYTSIYTSLYRPFQKQNIYFNKSLNNSIYLMPSIFPTQKHENLVICVSGLGGTKENSTLISNILPDLNCLDAGAQCFPLYYYEKDTNNDNILFSTKIIVDGYTRHDTITDYILKECQTKYDPKITKDDIFYYVYGLLHSKDYRTIFSDDLKKMLPRVPLVDKSDDFQSFSKAGRDLAEIHINYETMRPYSNVTITGEDIGNFTVDKLHFINKNDKSIIQYNSTIKISGIPIEAYDYIINGKSAIEWILDRYQVKIDKDSGIKNDPNDWAKEHNQPRYILDLLLRVITVSLETIKIVKNLPKLTF